MKEHYQPEGIRFYSQSMRKEMIYITEGPHKGWLAFNHPDGQWVSLHKASQSDIAEINGSAVNNVLLKAFRLTPPEQSKSVTP